MTPGDREAQAGSFFPFHGLGLVERFEELVQGLGGNAHARINDLEENA